MGQVGSAVAERILGEGGAVIGLDSQFDSEYGLVSVNQRCIHWKADLTDPEAIAEFMQFVQKQDFRIDALVNCIGIIRNEPLVSLFRDPMRHSVVLWDDVLRVNLSSVFLLSSFVAEHMLKRRNEGVLINIGSVTAKGRPGQSAYAASKAALAALSKVWARELGGFGIRCVTVNPGFIESESMRSSLSEQHIAELIENTPTKRLVGMHSVVSAILFALKNRDLTCTEIDVDGGLAF